MKPITENDLEQLSAYIDGELSDSERRFFQKRLCNDAELRAACERAWIASSVLKSQPLHLMPARSADAICAQCQPERSAVPWRMVASFAALAMITGLGFRYLQNNDAESVVQPQVAQVSAPSVPAAVTSGTSANSIKPGQNSASVLAQSKPAQSSVSASVASQDDPTQFALNEAALAKSWPKRDQVMEDYLIRHNQMSGAQGNDLISYAQMLTEPAPASEESRDNQ